jgi:hypothetical protein
MFDAFAMLGITGVGAAELVAYPYWCIEKGYARKTGPRSAGADWLARARGWVRVLRVDIWFSLVVYTLATLGFYFLGAAVLHNPQPGAASKLQTRMDLLLAQLASMYEPVMGAAGAKWFIVVGVFAVLYSTLYAATAGNSRALADWMKTNRFVTFRSGKDRLFWVRLFCVVFPVIDLGLFAIFGDPVSMVVAGGIAQALILPLLAVAAVYLRYRRTDPRLAPGIVWDVFLWLSMVVMFAAAAYAAYAAVQKAMAPPPPAA